MNSFQPRYTNEDDRKFVLGWATGGHLGLFHSPGMVCAYVGKHSDGVELWAAVQNSPQVAKCD